MTTARLALFVVLFAACGREEGESRRAESVSATSSSTSVPAPGTTSAGGNACPATGQWSRCAILERLDRAGLAPRVDSTPADEPPLTPQGLLIHLGSSEIELYLYPDQDAREREQRALDRTRYVAYDAGQSIRAEPTLITSTNMIAILHSTSSKQRERVSDAITAGPPQPPRP